MMVQLPCYTGWRLVSAVPLSCQAPVIDNPLRLGLNIMTESYVARVYFSHELHGSRGPVVVFDNHFRLGGIPCRLLSSPL